MAKSFRKTKLENRILQLSNQFLRTDAPEVSLKLVSFTKVIISSDFSEAELYWDTFDSTKIESITTSIANIEGLLRSYLAKELQIKHVPSLTLTYDSQYESEKNITELLDSEKSQGRKF